MKNQFILSYMLIMLILIGVNGTAKAQNLEWINAIGGKNVDMGLRVATDNDGNSYVTGNTTSDSFDFDTRGSGHKIAGHGSNDIFLGKYDAAGNFLWAKVLGNSGQDYGEAVAVDDSGNVFITGYFSDSVDFNPGNSGGVIAAVSGQDLFLAKYDAQGNFLWVQGVGGSSTDQGLGVATDSSGNVYVTGYSGSKSIDFNPNGTGGSVTTSSQLLFLAKYDANGTFQWVKDISGQSGQANGLDVTVDDSNYIYITGFFSIASIDFNPGGTGGVISPTGGGRDVFAAKYNDAGEMQWVRSMGGNKTDQGEGISVDKEGNVYIAGYIMSATADFNPGGNGDTLNNPNNSRMVFLVKLNASGDFQWVKGFEGDGSDYGMDVATDNTGNVFLAGYFNSDTIDFNPGGTGGKLSPVNSYDVFLAKYNKDGDFYWAKSMGGNGADYGQGVTIDRNNNVFLTGYSYPSSKNIPIDFNPGGSGGIIENMGSADVYLAKYSCIDTSSYFFRDTLACGGSYTLNDSIYTASGVYTQTFPNASGCDSTITLALTVLSIPQPVININHFTLGVAGSYPYATYQWLKDDNAIPGATDSTYTVTVNGDYQVAVSNEEGCTDTSDIYSITNAGIADGQNVASAIQIYPNPTSDRVYIDAPIPVRVTLSGMDGRILKQEDAPAVISTKGWATGLYLIQIRDRQGRLIKVEKLMHK